MPARIAKLPTYRGRPVPVTVLTLPDGTVDFRVTDTEAWVDVVKNRQCGICGEPLDTVVCFIGGPLSAQSRAFTDAPMHEECARYSAQACPYLAGQKAYADFQQIACKHAGKAALTEIPIAKTADPLPQVWMVKTTRVVIHITPDGTPVLVAQEPVALECLRR
jgi:hypothetical protein